VVAVPFGPYRVLEPLGIGGMATVNRAEITVDGAIYEVALKRLDAELATDRTYVRRFIAEARIGQLLRHPNIARTHEVGCIDETHFIAFEWIPGVTLTQVFDLALETAPPPVYITLRVLSQVARALAYSHELSDEQGAKLDLVHRDIAPSNIIIGDNGVTKLIDYGVAKSTIGHVRTVAGDVVGKLGYISPEYMKTGRCDARADIYSLGVVAWEMLVGRRLFPADTLDAAYAQRFGKIKRPSALNTHVPADADKIIGRMLQPDPARRWQTAGLLADALDEYIQRGGLGVGDADVSAWIMNEFGAPTRRKIRARTADIEQDVEVDVEEMFGRVRMRTEPSS
jgi:serine/threonine-protein kinase